MNWRVLSSRCAVSKEAISATCSSIVTVVGVAEEGLDVVARTDLLDVLLLRHHHAHHVGLDHGRVVGGSDELDSGAVRSQERPGRGLDGGDVDGLCLQKGRRLASRVLRHLHHLLVLVRGHGGCQRPRILIRLTGADDAAHAG
jgi:hypothetical protein